MKRCLLVYSILATGSTQAVAQAGQVTRVQRGDTTIVTTRGNGPWGPAFDAVPILRINANTRETTFGQVTRPVATADGGVVLIDATSLDGPVVRRFDSAGVFVHNLGRDGRGPGEFDSRLFAMGGLTSARDGSVTLLSRGLSRYASDGNFTATFTPLGVVGTEPVSANDGTFWLRSNSISDPKVPPGMRPMVRFDGAGKRLDSLVPRSWVNARAEPAPHQWWSVLPDGRTLQGRSDRNAFLITDPRGSGRPVIGERIVDPIRYTADERRELEAAEDFRLRIPEAAELRPRRTIPDLKPLSSHVSADLDGRIWVSRPGPGVKGEPRAAGWIRPQRGGPRIERQATWQDQTYYDAFLADGTYLGSVRFPLGVRPTFRGEYAWGIEKDADDTPVLVKYRITPLGRR